ncbi:MAG: hypothetical protein HYZ60_01320 [Methylocystis sp.]|nr:hypothetical protein [Methylocystis sp.]
MRDTTKGKDAKDAIIALPNERAGLALYNRLGFVIIGRRENYYLSASGERQAALTMRLEL